MEREPAVRPVPFSYYDITFLFHTNFFFIKNCTSIQIIYVILRVVSAGTFHLMECINFSEGFRYIFRGLN